MKLCLTNLFLKANMIEPACSAAFPTIGNKIMLIKFTEIPQVSDATYTTYQNRYIYHIRMRESLEQYKLTTMHTIASVHNILGQNGYERRHRNQPNKCTIKSNH